MAAIEAVAEEVATNLEEVAEVTRRINGSSAGFFLGGVVVGAGVGFYFGRRWNREKIKAQAFQEAEEEIAEMREMYRAREVARMQKPDVEEIIEKQGYSTKERPLPAPVPISPVPVHPAPVAAPPVMDGWDYASELAQRSPEQPYVIHKDEFGESELYSQTSYIYYSVDDVLTDTDRTPVPHGDLVVGQDNLKWGHGSEDRDTVFIRNERMELEIEITRVPQSYEEEVLGITRNDTTH